MILLSTSENNKFLALSGALVAIFLAALDQTIVTTAMPKIVEELSGAHKLSWVFTGYMLFSTVFIPVYGKLSDIYGRQRFYLATISLFIISSMGAGCSPSMEWLIFCRCVQGVAGGAILVNSLALIGDLFEPLERGKWQGFISVVYAVSSLAGPVIGGAIADNMNWSWIFYINLPLGIVAMVIILRSVAPTKFNINAGKKVDYVGAFLLAASLIPLLLALEACREPGTLFNPKVVGLLLVFAIMLLLFIISQQRSKEPIISIDILKQRSSLLPIIVGFIFSFCKFSLIVYMPLFCYQVFKVSSIKSGLIMSPMMVGMLVASIGSGYVLAHTGRHRSLCFASIFMYCGSFWLLSFDEVFTNPYFLVFSMVLAGLGNGMSMPLMNVLVTTANVKEKMGEATAALQLARNVGGTAGIAVFGCIVNTHKMAGMLEVTSQVYLAAFFIALCAVPLIWLIPSTRLISTVERREPQFQLYKLSGEPSK